MDPEAAISQRVEARAHSAEARRVRLRAGWTPPGPAAAAPSDLAPEPGETLDALCGDWRIFQLRNGHRYSADDLLLAWYAVRSAREAGLEVRRALDLGSGIGSVGLMVAWQLPEARFVTLEAQSRSLELARRSARYNGVTDRFEVLAGDLRALSSELGGFDLVTGSPPYFPYFQARAGVVSDRPQRGPCRFELRGGVEDYCAAAAQALAPRGRVALVMATAGRSRVLAGAAAAGLAVERMCPVIFKAPREPMIDLICLRSVRDSPAAEAPVEPPLVLREATGERSEAFREVRLAMGFPPRAA